MRQALIDHAQQRAAQKHQRETRIALEGLHQMDVWELLEQQSEGEEGLSAAKPFYALAT